MTAELRGLSEVLRNLNREIKKLRLHTVGGLNEAALVVKFSSVNNTPIDLANLRGSAYILVTGKSTSNPGKFRGEDAAKMASQHENVINSSKSLVKNKIYLQAIVGYTANYAFWVHEMPMLHAGKPRGKPRKGLLWHGGSNKFLQKAIMKNQRRIYKILVKWAKK